MDIFPIDRIPEGGFRKKQFLWNCLRYQLYTREYEPSQASWLAKTLSSLLLHTKSAETRNRARRELLKKITENNGNLGFPTVAIETTSTMRQELPKDLLDKYIEMEFENGRFMCFDKWKDYLEVKYGDYMKLPPKEEQTWKHHPIILDFAHNYDEL